jgi:hypothetical protein
MKKKVLTQDALSALYSEEEAPEVKGDEGQEQEVKPEDEVAVDASEAIVNAEEDNAEELKAKVEKLERDFDDFKASAAEDAERVTAEHMAAVEQLEAINVQLKTIVADQARRFRLALNLATVDFKDMSSEDVMKEFKHAEEQFKKLPKGSVVPEPTNSNKEAVVKSSHVVSAFNATGLK